MYIKLSICLVLYYFRVAQRNEIFNCIAGDFIVNLTGITISYLFSYVSTLSSVEMGILLLCKCGWPARLFCLFEHAHLVYFKGERHQIWHVYYRTVRVYFKYQ